MSKNLKKSLAIATLLTTVFAAQVQAAKPYCGPPAVRSTPTPAPTRAPAQPQAAGVIYKVVQRTPQYDLRRPEVISGARVTLFANFLRDEPGIVMFNLHGTSTECTLVQWQPNSVTVELPRLGLLEPKNAEIQIILPDGRVAKTFPVLFISQPDIVIHEDSVPQPMPPAPTARSAVYAAAVGGGLMLSAGVE
jgi:hypothetical protein